MDEFFVVLFGFEEEFDEVFVLFADGDDSAAAVLDDGVSVAFDVLLLVATDEVLFVVFTDEAETFGGEGAGFAV